MYDHILVPTDGSDTATVAVDHADDLRTEYDADLDLVVDERSGDGR